jgi:type II secretion system protein G
MFQAKSTLRRLAEKRENEQGFTLIELMVVVLIIGVLVAIAVPVFLNAQNGAKQAGAKADLKNASTEVAAIASDTGSLPAATTGFQLILSGATAPTTPFSRVSAGTSIVANWNGTTMTTASGAKCYRITFATSLAQTQESTTYTGKACGTTWTAGW